jgi:hypothetical protein
VGLGQWLQNAAADLSHWINDAGGYTAPASQYRDPVEAARENAPQQAQSGVDPTLQATLQGMNWARNNFISQPISTAFLMSGEMSAKPLSQQPNFLFNSGNWSQAWEASKHISPGQALAINNVDDFAKAVNSPLVYYKPADALLPQGFNSLPSDQQNELLKEAGMPAVGNQFIESKRQDSNLFKYGSGAADFAFSWYADPTTLAGKAIGRLRSTVVEAGGLSAGELAAQAIKHPFTGSALDVTPLTRPAPTLAQRAVGNMLPTFMKPQAGWTARNINNLVNSSRMGAVQDFLWANKDDPQLINNTVMAKTSAMGPRFGAIVSTLQSPQEVNLFLRSGIGDITAQGELESQNAAARLTIEQDQARLATMGLQRGFVTNPLLAQLIDSRMNQVEAGINANMDQVQRYNSILAHQGEIDNIKDTQLSFMNAIKGQIAQNVYQTGAARPLVALGMPNLGLAKSRMLSKYFQTPVTIIRSFSNYNPHGYVDVNDLTQDSVNELRGFLARVPGITPDVRQNMLNEYLKAPDEGSRLNVLQDMGKLGMAKVAAKYGLSPEIGEAIYREDRQRLGVMQDNLRQYTTAQIQQGGNLRPIRADAFTDTGGAISIHPNLVARLINSHIMPNLDRYDIILRRNTSALEALHLKAGNAYDAVRAGLDFFQHAWKFGELFRLGYIPRVLGDDLGGQIARLGMASMALRAGWGIKNLATNASTMMLKPYYQAAAETKRIGIQYADNEIVDLQGQIAKEEGVHAMYVKAGSKAYNKAQGQLTAAQKQLDIVQKAGIYPQARIDQLNQLVQQRAATAAATPVGVGVVPAARLQRLADYKSHLQWLTDGRAQMQEEMRAAIAAQEKVRQGDQAITINGVPIPGAFQGVRGQYFQQVISPDESLANVFNTNRQLIHGNLMRSWDHGAVQVNAIANESLHGQAWAHLLNAQMGQDAAARRVLQDAANGVHVDQSAANLMAWFKTPEGYAYRQRLGLKMVGDDQVANSIAYDVHEMAPLPGIAQKALEPDGVTPSFLKSAIPNPSQRPDAIAPGIGQNYTLLRYHRTLDKVIQHWFNTVNEMPAKTWSRHPLFNQLYEAHANSLMQTEAAQGAVHTVADADRIAETARRLAVRDTRKLVFDIAHKSDAAAALSLVTPFFSATAEGWQRWARIIAERPEVAGYASKFFNVPLSLGMIQNNDGETITKDGMVYDPSQGKMVEAPMSDRYIVARVPQGLLKLPGLGALIRGVTSANEQGQMKLSQESMNLVLAGDPWFNPGQGPIVTIPVNEFVKDKPTDAQLAQQMGILPFGPSTANGLVGRLADQYLPSAIKDFLSAYNTSDYRYQQVKLQIMQQAQFNHDNFGAPMPSASQIAARVKDYWRFSAFSAFVRPFSGQNNDPFTFYRQQYNNLLRTNPNTADQEYLSRYGESHFIFAQNMSKNLSGAPATMKAAALEQKYGDLIAKYPDLAPLIIGPEGNGPFSPAAYTYELNNPLSPGSAEMMRTRLTADQAMAENQTRLGWVKYTGFMNGLTATLVSRGLTNMSSAGAQDLRAAKTAFISMMSNPMLPDGKPNPYYNDAWSTAFNSYDKLKTARLVAGMSQLVNDPANASMLNDPARSDLRVLQQYIGFRNQVTTELAQRKAQGGSESLSSSSNSDLLDAWNTQVGNMIEGDVSFGNLYHRYLSKDLGVDAMTPELLAATQAADAADQQQQSQGV